MNVKARDIINIALLTAIGMLAADLLMYAGTQAYTKIRGA